MSDAARLLSATYRWPSSAAAAPNMVMKGRPGSIASVDTIRNGMLPASKQAQLPIRRDQSHTHTHTDSQLYDGSPKHICVNGACMQCHVIALIGPGRSGRRLALALVAMRLATACQCICCIAANGLTYVANGVCQHEVIREAGRRGHHTHQQQAKQATNNVAA